MGKNGEIVQQIEIDATAKPKYVLLYLQHN